jgi:hypothetical protein
MFPFKKKSRKLTAPKLTPDVLKDTGGYLAVPSQLINCANYGLKPAHLAVLLYLLAKPAFTKDGEQWRVVYNHMANQLGIGETYAPKYVTFLHEKGFISFKRNDKGETEWIVTLPDFFVKTNVAAESSPEPSVEPHRQNIHGDNIHVEIVAPLYINKVVDITKETTTAVVPENNAIPTATVAAEKKPAVSNSENNAIQTVTVAAEVEAKIPSSLPTAHKKAVKNELAKLPCAELQLNVLIVLAAALAKGTVGNAIGLTNDLVKKALNGTLTLPKTTEKPLSPFEKEELDKQRLIKFFNKNFESLKHHFIDLKKDYIHVAGLGNITHCTFKELLAMNGDGLAVIR